MFLLFSPFLHFGAKNLKKHIPNSVWSVQHPKGDQNKQYFVGSGKTPKTIMALFILRLPLHQTMVNNYLMANLQLHKFTEELVFGTRKCKRNNLINYNNLVGHHGGTIIL